MIAFRPRTRAVGMVLALMSSLTMAGSHLAAASTRARATPPIPGRHLEVPWWERIDEQHGPETTTYVVPADILFDVDSTSIRADGREQLVGLASQLVAARDVLVRGHTDGTGSPAHNDELGLGRAEAGRRALADAGVPTAIIRTESVGAREPVADESGPDPASARARNRRIEIVVSA